MCYMGGGFYLGETEFAGRLNVYTFLADCEIIRGEANSHNAPAHAPVIPRQNTRRRLKM